MIGGLLGTVLLRLSGSAFDQRRFTMGLCMVAALVGWILVALGAAPEGRTLVLLIPFATSALALCWIGLASLGKPGPTGSRRALIAAPLTRAVVAVSVVAMGTHAGYARTDDRARSSREATNLVLIVVDTLRADHTDLDGRAQGRTPGLARLAADSATVLDSASSSSSHTVPSVLSLVTGWSPPAIMLKSATGQPGSAPTLAEHLRAAGHRTGALSANGLLDHPQFRHGFDDVHILKGFTYFQDSFFLSKILGGGALFESMRIMARRQLHKQTAPAVADLALRWVDAADDMPFFLYVQFMDPHWPYHWRGSAPAPELAQNEPLSYVDLLREGKGRRKSRYTPSHPGIREMRGRYEDEIRLVDEAIDGLVRGLEERGLADSTLVVVTSDHGEEFFEHGQFSHGHELHEEQIHVPLILRWPLDGRFGEIPTRISEPISLVDLMPTLLDYLGAEGEPSPSVAGRSLRGLIEGTDTERAARPVTAEIFPLAARGKIVSSYREGSLKVRFVGPDRTHAAPQVFDLATDPGERRPLDKEEPEAAALIERAQNHYRSRQHAGAQPQEGSDDSESPDRDPGEEQLRALGYVE